MKINLEMPIIELRAVIALLLIIATCLIYLCWTTYDRPVDISFEANLPEVCREYGTKNKSYYQERKEGQEQEI